MRHLFANIIISLVASVKEASSLLPKRSVLFGVFLWGWKKVLANAADVSQGHTTSELVVPGMRC